MLFRCFGNLYLYLLNMPVLSMPWRAAWRPTYLTWHILQYTGYFAQVYCLWLFLVLSTCKRFCARWHRNIVELALYTYNIVTIIIIIIIIIITFIIFHLMHDWPDLYVLKVLKVIHQRTPSAYSNTAAICLPCVSMQGKHIRYRNGISSLRCRTRSHHIHE